MNTFEQDMKAAYEKLEKEIETIASLFPNAKKGYLGDNNLLLDFNKKDYNEAVETTKAFNSTGDRAGRVAHEGIEFRLSTFPKTNRIALTF